MEKELFVRAEEVARELGISKPYAYKLVREMNEELKKKGFLTIPGRVSRRYFEEKFYGLRDRQYESARTHAGRSIKLTLEEPQA